MTTVEDVLEHIGVKGMKWGVRRRSSSKESKPWADKETGDTIEVSSGRKGKVVVTGVKKKPPSEDAQRLAILKEVVKKSGKQALTNKELKEFNDRIKLEDTLAKNLAAHPGKMERGKKYVGALLVDVANKQVSKVAHTLAGRQVDKLLMTKEDRTKAQEKAKENAKSKSKPKATPSMSWNATQMKHPPGTRIIKQREIGS